MSSYTEVRIDVPTTGDAGSATGTVVSAPIHGNIEMIAIIPHQNAPNTTDVTIAEVGGAGRTLLALSDITASGYYPVRQEIVDSTGTGLGTYDLIVLAGRPISVLVEDADELGIALSVILIVSHP